MCSVFIVIIAVDGLFRNVHLNHIVKNTKIERNASQIKIYIGIAITLQRNRGEHHLHTKTLQRKEERKSAQTTSNRFIKYSMILRKNVFKRIF